MTTVFPEMVRCFMCGAENEIMVIASTNAFGPPDLDTRPPEMKRSTMCYWVRECRKCGYSACDLTDETTVDRGFLDTDAYMSCDGIPFISDLAKAFYRQYLIQAAEGNHEEAFFAVLHAAWACDDAEDEENAGVMRGKAVELADRLLVTDGCDWKDTVRLIRADLMRRTGRFDELLEQYQYASFGEALLNRIIGFEKKLARRHCAGRFTVEDAENDAAGGSAGPGGE